MQICTGGLPTSGSSIEEALCSVAVEVVAVLQVNHARGVVLQDGMLYTELRQNSIGNLAKHCKQDSARARQ